MRSALMEKWIVCRICLQQPNETMKQIFDTDARADLTQMIFECGGVPIKQFDHYPDKICMKCLKYLRVAHKFRITCQRSYKHLSRFIAPVDIDKETSSGEADEIITASIDDDAPNSIDFEEDDQDTVQRFVVQLDAEADVNVDIKEEFSELEDEVVDVYTPMIDEEFEEIKDFEPIDRDGMHINEVVEYLDDVGDQFTSDEEYLPKKSENARKTVRSRGRPPKVESLVKKQMVKATTSRPTSTSSSLVQMKNDKVKRLRLKNKDDKLKTYICDVCGNIYPTQGRLKEHIKSHNGIKPHECEICGHAFAQNQQLARHMNTHTGNRPYKCQYCPSAFADLSTRNKHHRIHTNERPYVCDVCGKAFSYTNTLKFHKMIHTGEKPFVCEICGKGFHQAYKLRNHKVTHEKRGVKIEKMEENSMEAYQEVSEAAAQILEI